MIVAAALAIALQTSSGGADWQPRPIEGGVTYFDRNSVLDNGRYRSINIRIDVDRDGIASYLTRIEVDCAGRRVRARNLAAYDAAGRELISHRLGERPFSSASGAMYLVEEACSHPSPQRDPVPADAPSSYSRSISAICGTARERRLAGDAGWLDRMLGSLSVDPTWRTRIALDCEAYETGLAAGESTR